MKKLIFPILIIIGIITVVFLFNYPKLKMDCEIFSDITSSEITHCGSISSNGVYLLKQDICSSKNCIVINSDNVELDCDKHTIFGPEYGFSLGISFTNRSDITIKNCFIKGFSNGVYIGGSINNIIIHNTIDSFNQGISLWSRSNDNTIKENTLIGNGDAGIGIHYSNNNIVSNNYVQHNGDSGIFLAYANSSRIFNNTATKNGFGIRLGSSYDNVIFDNILTDNHRGIFTTEFTSNNTVKNNKICSNSDWDLKCDQRDDIIDEGNNMCKELYNCLINCVPCED
jgi:parallel beta-helix repeat protein